MALAVVQAASVALMAPALAALKISSPASLVVALRVILMLRAKGMIQYRVNLRFEEAIFGAEKEIKYNREATCRTCDGSGAKPGTSPVTCGRCHGSGVINVDTQTPLGMMRRQVTCDVCHGRGKEIKSPCETCHGTGHEKQAHSVKVKIPAGVETGQQVRLSGQGEAGFNGGPYGDLYVVVQVEPSDKFERDGSTITTSSISTLSKQLLVTVWIFQLFTGMWS